jgi:hypothetical protein
MGSTVPLRAHQVDVLARGERHRRATVCAAFFLQFVALQFSTRLPLALAGLPRSGLENGLRVRKQRGGRWSVREKEGREGRNIHHAEGGNNVRGERDVVVRAKY